ncbi:endonuclease/exonuclease/phosphatase family protein [Flavobacterium crassostreae]|uniref:Endonuclease n=1 Tax=Flavobacterium crassostreae TaxID=1763534 RepID=A0A1B9E8Z8_9FLAO|nr:endonuclease/exonuclease/phosphatase family protein [Flavobacterium crassostreae]OCB78440.1 endonuclease [Flavobacterium crassostreae]
MKIYCTTFLLFFYALLFSQTKLLSWNIENIGRSKSAAEIEYMAQMIHPYDVIAIQEVVAGYGGAQAIARLAAALNRHGSNWDYTISDPTSSSAYKTERYAFIWKTANIKKIGAAWLEKTYHLVIDREPFLCTFEKEDKQFTVVNFHAVTKSQQPEKEIKYFKFLPEQYPDLNLVFAGDFNCPQSHTVFNPLKKMGYLPSLVKQKTSLKRGCKQQKCLASELDNIYYNSSRLQKIKAGIIPFYTAFTSLKEARKISDHVPVWLEFDMR